MRAALCWKQPSLRLLILIQLVLKMKKSVQYWYREPDGILPNYSEENPSQYHFAHHKPHRDRAVFEPVLSR
jgi:hypothetical protein